MDKKDIIAAALRLMEQDGLKALSTRRLAQALGISGPTLYWHFKNKQDIIDHMAEAILAAAEVPNDSGRKWDQALTETAAVVRAAALSHRDGAAVLAMCRPTGNSAISDSYNETLSEFQALGLSEQQAKMAILSMSRFALGWAIAEEAAKDRVSTIDQDEGFNFGVQALVNGIRAAIATAADKNVDGGGQP
jgi:TetR/AcrR family tetracycline transcriptional repressor